jgi:hypothetical protein
MSTQNINDQQSPAIPSPYRPPLLLHTSSGAIQLSSFGSFHADTDVARCFKVSVIVILPVCTL